MKKITSILFLFFASIAFSQVSIVPNPFEVNESITITVDANSTLTNCNGFSNPTKVYMHSGIGDDNDAWGFNVVGNWGQDDGVGEMTNNGDGTWSITFVPETYYSLSVSEAQNAIKMGVVFRNEDGSQELKDNGCSDFYFDVGTFQVSLTSPVQNSTTILNSGDNLSVSATNIGGNADYVLKANDAIIDTQSGISSYSFTHTNITNNQIYSLEATLNGTTIIKKFTALVDPGVSVEFMPTNYQDGITYLSDTEAVLVLYASGKDFIYVAGSFNDWQPDSNYAMKYDPSRNKYWLTLSGLTPGQIETYQYWVVDKTPPTNSPELVKVADPYSTLVLSPFDDPWIPSTSYPNLPPYPIGQEREVTVLETGQTPYNWQVTNFIKPKKEDLVIYEVLIRDFDADRNYQDLIDKIDYFKNLNINAIELMPVMEYEGNESWGYNTAFHMALDKFYGTEDKLKELVDTFHQNGIAVILDVALNHAFGRNPMVRMWMDDPDGDGWGGPNSSNPYFNVTAKHAYSVGYDFNHSSARTQDYVHRVIKHWIEDFHIDGFRWDLTKGFTQNCSASDETCTNNYQQDRVDILKNYVDYSWSLDPYHYAIFEHLGSDVEEQQWANYRIGETPSKGVMMWKEIWNDYKSLGQGNTGNIVGMGNDAHGFTEKRALGYPESHDKDRIMYEMVTYGNSNGSYDIHDLNTALSRMKAIGAISLTIPGPKMVWHFADLGMDISIWTCENGIVNSDYDGNDDGDCKLATKPQPQWANNWLGDSNRNQIYNAWSRLNALKINEDVFEGSYSINSGNLTPRIYIWDDAIPTTELKNVVILANFDVVVQNIVPDFPYTGTWYDLMDDSGATSMNVTSTTATINLQPGEFRIYGNQAVATLGVDEFDTTNVHLYPNPANNQFSLNTQVSRVAIYDLTGKLVKEFNGDFDMGYPFDISTLNKSIYLVKIKTNSGASKTTKLVKF